MQRFQIISVCLKKKSSRTPRYMYTALLWISELLSVLPPLSLSLPIYLFSFSSHSFLSPLHFPHSNISYPSIYPSIHHPSIHPSSTHTPLKLEYRKTPEVFMHIWPRHSVSWEHGSVVFPGSPAVPGKRMKKSIAQHLPQRGGTPATQQGWVQAQLVAIRSHPLTRQAEQRIPWKIPVSHREILKTKAWLAVLQF